MSDTRSPPLASSFAARAQALAAGWQAVKVGGGGGLALSEAGPGHASSSGRESRRAASRALAERTRSKRRWIAGLGRRPSSAAAAVRAKGGDWLAPCCSRAALGGWCSAFRSGPARRHRRNNRQRAEPRCSSPCCPAHQPPRPMRRSQPGRAAQIGAARGGPDARPAQALVSARPCASAGEGRRRRRNVAEERGGGTGAERNASPSHERRKKPNSPSCRRRPRSASRRPSARSWRGAKLLSPPCRA